MVLFRLLLPRLHTAASHRLLSSSSAGAQSEVYTYALRYKRPITVPYNLRKSNSISLIGAIASPLKKSNTKNEAFFVHTHLRVAGGVYPHFRVLVSFCGEIGKTVANYLKPNQLVLVQGCLNSWMGDDGNGNHTRRFSVQF